MWVPTPGTDPRRSSNCRDWRPQRSRPSSSVRCPCRQIISAGRSEPGKMATQVQTLALLLFTRIARSLVKKVHRGYILKLSNFEHTYRGTIQIGENLSLTQLWYLQQLMGRSFCPARMAEYPKFKSMGGFYRAERSPVLSKSYDIILFSLPYENPSHDIEPLQLRRRRQR